jgi:hypothetical protein
MRGVFLETYNRPPWNDNWTREKALGYLQEYADNKRFVGFTLLEGGEIIGAIFCHENTWWTTTSCLWNEFFISPDHQAGERKTAAAGR